jgi:hypothetical protein
MGKKSSPPAPDYAAAATAQAAANKDAAQYNSELNRVNQVTPYGSLTWNQSTGADGKPVWTQTMALSPEQQALQAGQDKLSQSYLNTANSAVGRVSDAMATPFDTSKLRDPTYMGTGGTSAQVQTPYTNIGQGPDMQTVGQGPQFQNFDMSKYMGEMPSAPQLSGASSGSITRSFDTSGVRALPGQIDDTSRKRVEEAIMSRINPQYQADEQALRTRLLNSGIEVGTDAYNREMNNFSQRLNDARMQAVLSGGQEESRQVGLIQGLQGQEFNQAYQKGKFGQDADVAMANNALQATSINNQAALGMYNAQLAGQGQRFSQGLAGTQFNNNLGQQQFQNQLTGAGFNNSAGQQQFQNQLAGAQFANNAADTATQRQMQIDQITNAMGLANNQYNNQASQQQMQQQAYLRQLPLNEINALRTGSQVQGPQFQQYYTGGNAAAAPIFDASVAQGNYTAAANSANQSGSNALLGGLASMGSAWLSSDPRLKTDIIRVGTHPLGVGIYDYTIAGKRVRGVMSTEVRAVMPSAVAVDSRGYDMVDYAAIGGV